jgi:Skp family chaperone for outer membrane proteins
MKLTSAQKEPPEANARDTTLPGSSGAANNITVEARMNVFLCQELERATSEMKNDMESSKLKRSKEDQERKIKDRERDMKDRERDMKSRERDLKDQERDLKDQERDLKDQERDMRERDQRRELKIAKRQIERFQAVPLPLNLKHCNKCATQLAKGEAIHVANQCGAVSHFS